MRSRLLYVVPLLLSTVPASAQYWGGGPGYPYAGPSAPPVDPYVMNGGIVSSTTTYPMYQPIEQVVVRRRIIMPPAPVVVQPAPVIVRPQVIVREKIVYVNKPRKRVVHKPRPPCNCAN